MRERTVVYLSLSKAEKKHFSMQKKINFYKTGGYGKNVRIIQDGVTLVKCAVALGLIVTFFEIVTPEH